MSKLKSNTEIAIKSMRLINGTAFGRECIIHQSLVVNGRDTTRVDNVPVELGFDQDSRFIRVTHGTRFTLVPLANVGSISCELVTAE